MMSTTASDAVRDVAKRVAEHPVYGAVRTLDGLRVFLEHHVICVFDFMSLLKRLQAELTCTSSPWVPAPDGTSARLINEIVLDEETDPTFEGGPTSHYSWYLAAMDEVGADTQPMREFESRLRLGQAPAKALKGCGLPPAAEAFAQKTFEQIQGPLHVVAGAFVLSREDVIPKMFTPFALKLREAGIPTGLLLGYLERHIEIDSEEHGPASLRLLDRIVDQDVAKREEAYRAAEEALILRAKLWDAVQAQILLQQ